ncbi:MAG: 23S rRNA (pseudouridine(1915)-N(3))-methyltransferase RlmH [Methanomicrobiales archaeon]
MQIRIIAVGKIKERYLQEGVAEFEKRLRPYTKLQILEIPDEKRPLAATTSVEARAMEKEGERILAAIPPGAFIVALDPSGTIKSSEEFAVTFRHWGLAGKNHICFLIGGDLGFAPAVLTRSDERLSLSRMTFTHPMARFLLLEQIYRVQRINHGEPYHK